MELLIILGAMATVLLYAILSELRDMRRGGRGQ